MNPNSYPKIDANNATEEQIAEAQAQGWSVTTSIMNGKKLWIREDEKGGVCDPGTERYWSM